jgi:hypothetical protein
MLSNPENRTGSTSRTEAFNSHSIPILESLHGDFTVAHYRDGPYSVRPKCNVI